METIQQNQYPGIHLKKVLRSYQAAAMSSLRGPGTFMSAWNSDDSTKRSPDEDDSDETVSSIGTTSPQVKGFHTKFGVNGGSGEYDPFLAPPPFPIQQMPIFTPADQTKSERTDTILEGEIISSFVVGGEKRLCLPQILITVLSDFSLHQINSVCNDLHIFCSRCNQEQLDVLKLIGVLPLTAPSCGLITKTDAERLSNALLHSNPPKAPPDIDKTENKLQVFHACFGKCKGVVYPDLYKTSSSLAIECCECHGLFSPDRFVCHVHKSLENRTCHWGFDSTNWRCYLLLAKGQENDTTVLQKRLDEFKLRFKTAAPKRKQGEHHIQQDIGKKVKAEDGSMKVNSDAEIIGSTPPYWLSSNSRWPTAKSWPSYNDWFREQQKLASQFSVFSSSLKPTNSSDVTPSYLESHLPYSSKQDVSSMSNQRNWKRLEESIFRPISANAQSSCGEHKSATIECHEDPSCMKIKNESQSQSKSTCSGDGNRKSCIDDDISVHSENSSCSTVTAGDEDEVLEARDLEVNKKIEEIRKMLVEQKLDDGAVAGVISKVLKIKSLYVDTFRVSLSDVCKDTSPRGVARKDSSPEIVGSISVKSEIVECES